MTRWLLILLATVMAAAACAPLRVPPMVSEAAISCRTPSVQWFGPDDLTDRRRLDAWCAGVGPVVFAGSHDAAAREIALAGITFVSCNVTVGTGDIIRFITDFRPGRLKCERPRFVVMLS